MSIQTLTENVSMPSLPNLPWYEEDPGRLVAETQAYIDADITMSLDDNVLSRLNLVVYEGCITVDGEEIRLSVWYSPDFPYVRPEVYAPDLELSLHQNPVSKNLCLLPNVGDAWLPEMRGADLVKQAARLISDHNKGLDIVKANDVGGPEPYVTWYRFTGQDALLIPQEYVELDLEPGTKGDMQLDVIESSSSWFADRAYIYRLAISSVSIPGAGVTKSRYTLSPGLAATPARWLVLDSPPPASLDASAIWQWIERIDSELRGWVRTSRHRKQLGYGAVALTFMDEGPSRDERHRTWLLLLVDPRGEARLCRPVYATHQAMSSRIPHLKLLRDHRVAIIGLGTIGSAVAVDLARSGIGGLLIADDDYLEPANLTRHVCTMSDAGLSKVEAVGRLIKLINPTIEVQPAPRMGHRPIGNLERLRALPWGQLLEPYSTIIMATGDGNSHKLMSHMNRHLNKPVLYSWATPAAWGGRVFLEAPGEACYECFARHDQVGSIEKPPDDPEADPIYSHGCGYPGFAGAGFDLLNVSGTTARLAVRYLLENPLRREDELINYAVIGNGYDDSLPFVRFAHISSHQACSSCSLRKQS